MKRILKLLARLYPSSWRERYGSEYEALLEDASPRTRDAFDVLWGAWKMQMTSWSFVRIVLMCSLAGTVGAVAISLIPSKKYVSQTLITVNTSDRRSIDKELLERVETGFDRSDLASIIQRENLYTSERARMPINDVVDLMKKNIFISRVQTKDDKLASALVLYFGYPDPHVAQRVNNLLVSRLMNLNLQAAINAPSASPHSHMTWRVDQPASLPQKPVFPKRRLFGVGGLMTGLVGGLTLATIARRRRAAVANA